MGEIYNQALALYLRGNFSGAMERLATDFGESKEEERKSFLLGSKIMLQNFGTGFPIEQGKETLLSSIDMACQRSETIEQLTDAEWDLLSTLESIIPKALSTSLEQLKRKPNLTQYQQHIPLYLELSQLRVDIMMRIRSCALIDRLAEEAGLPVADFRKTHFTKTPEMIEDEAIAKLEYEFERSIFENLKSYHQQNDHCTMEYAQTIGNNIIQCNAMLDCLAGNVEQNSSMSAPEVQCERLLKHAEILRYVLESVLHVNGSTVPILGTGSGRKSSINQLRTIYKKVEELDPGFVAPSLPPESVPLITVEPSGGCYVATAVYGSYDCPEVWTLRRFRDNILAPSWYGRAFIRTYYATSPKLVKWFGKTHWFKNMWKPKLDRLVKRLNREGIADTPYQDRQW